ncbi:MAG TPA: type II toxin-antitoxin system VapC family toxin [Candidatus Thermoplasmatota archaeon]|nr:type II toxin-antitoxin system VapC family toxin [Candidatus Thermoplasmatota archaeon]
MAERVVLDASVGIRIVVQEEPGHEEATRCYDHAARRGWDVVTTDLFLYEVGNVLARGRAQAGRAPRLLDALQLAEVRRPSPNALARALGIAGEGKLSFYDAAYLALAEETDGLVWTEDRELLKRFPGRTTDTRELERRLR